MRTKRRILPFQLGSGSTVRTDKHCLSGDILLGPDQRRSASNGSVNGSQVTDSEGHAYRRLNASEGDMGGPFFSQRKYYVGKPSVLNYPFTGIIDWPGQCTQHTLVTDAWPINPKQTANYPFPPNWQLSDSQLNQLGATAVRLSNPTNALGDLATFLAELKERLPSLPNVRQWEASTNQALNLRLDPNLIREGGSEYLNYQFGWKPTVDDIVRHLRLVIDAERVMRQFRRDAGKVVRRRWTFPTEYQIDPPTIIKPATPLYAAPGFGWLSMDPSDPGVVRVRNKERRVWFSGAFSYHLPFGLEDGIVGDAERASYMLGLTLTPDLVWNMAPWSWAVDWVSNIGDVLANVSDYQVYGLVLRYGYLMEHTIVTDTYSRISPKCFTYKGVSIGSHLSLITETKRRIRANPYGFGVSWDGLSTFQLSILAALGISRGDRSG